MRFSCFCPHLPMDSALNFPVFNPTAFPHSQVPFPFFSFKTTPPQYLTLIKPPTILRCSNSSTNNSNTSNMPGLPVKKKRKRYRKQYPGESEGITEEMRFVAMRLRNIKGKKLSPSSGSDSETDATQSEEEGEEGRGDRSETEKSNENGGDGEAETWSPTMEGFLKYLVDSKLVFNTIERIIDESDDVAYAYFRKTGLERSACLSKDLEWFSQRDFVVPEPSNPGVLYVTYLEELAEKSAPLFLSHFYNIYFSHIAGGQVIARKILEGRELEFYKWEGDVQESLKSVREKLNMLGEHWSRDDRNKSLKEAAKSFKQCIDLVVGIVGAAYEWNINITVMHLRTLMSSSSGDIVTLEQRHSAKGGNLC
ncbi:hypothetical protein V6N13_120900 [Hibiscus sabdariffa]